MTAPTYESTTVTDFGSDSTTHNANMPATVNSGDLLLAFVAMDDVTTITTPSGWTLLLENPASSVPQFGLYGKVAAGTEGGTTVNFATSASQRGSVHVIRVSAWFGTLDGVISSLSRTSAGGSEISGGIGSTAKDVLWIASQCKSTTTAFGTAPSGYANENKTNVSEDTSASAAIATATKTSTANREAITALWNTASTFVGVLVAVLPSVTPPATGGGAPIIGSPIVRAA